MAWRESFDVAPLIHQNPIPTASRVGNMLYTSVISGRDPETSQVPDSPEQQALNVFKNLAMVLAQGGATPGDVAHVTVWIRNSSYRPLVNGPWLEMFPDKSDRPARHAILDPNLSVAVVIEAMAVIQGSPG